MFHIWYIYITHISRICLFFREPKLKTLDIIGNTKIHKDKWKVSLCQRVRHRFNVFEFTLLDVLAVNRIYYQSLVSDKDSNQCRKTQIFWSHTYTQDDTEKKTETGTESGRINIIKFALTNVLYNFYLNIASANDAS